jgi:hypothetical protein
MTLVFVTVLAASSFTIAPASITPGQTLQFTFSVDFDLAEGLDISFYPSNMALISPYIAHHPHSACYTASQSPPPLYPASNQGTSPNLVSLSATATATAIFDQNSFKFPIAQRIPASTPITCFVVTRNDSTLVRDSQLSFHIVVGFAAIPHFASVVVKPTPLPVFTLTNFTQQDPVQIVNLSTTTPDKSYPIQTPISFLPLTLSYQNLPPHSLIGPISVDITFTTPEGHSTIIDVTWEHLELFWTKQHFTPTETTTPTISMNFHPSTNVRLVSPSMASTSAESGFELFLLTGPPVSSTGPSGLSGSFTLPVAPAVAKIKTVYTILHQFSAPNGKSK